jgi:hypothetical protein
MSVVGKLKWVQYESRRILLLLTFIGVVIHEYAHKHLCNYYYIPVKETCYFQLDNPPGYVVHGRPKAYIHGFMISIAPAFVNSLIGVLAGGVAGLLLVDSDSVVIGFLSLGVVDQLLVGVLLWVGISSAVHFLPSEQDASEIWSQTRSNWYNPLVLAVIPVTFLIEVLNRLRLIYLDVVVGIVFVMIGFYFGVNDEIVLNLIGEVISIEEIAQ